MKTYIKTYKTREEADLRNATYLEPSWRMPKDYYLVVFRDGEAEFVHIDDLARILFCSK